MLLYIENPRDATRKLLELINEFGKDTEYKINAQKFLAFLCINKKRAEREIKETIPFTIETKRIITSRKKIPPKEAKTCNQKTIKY